MIDGIDAALVKDDEILSREVVFIVDTDIIVSSADDIKVGIHDADLGFILSRLFIHAVHKDVIVHRDEILVIVVSNEVLISDTDLFACQRPVNGIVGKLIINALCVSHTVSRGNSSDVRDRGMWKGI